MRYLPLKRAALLGLLFPSKEEQLQQQQPQPKEQ